MLGVILPHGDRTWFVKLVGNPEPLDGELESFTQFLKSLSFSGDRDVKWATPDGWRELPATGMRYATFQIGSKDEPAELTITSLGSEASPILPNVNRWRGQIGLPPLNEVQLAENSEQREIAGVTATLVDFTGHAESHGAATPPFAKTPAPTKRKTPPATASSSAGAKPPITFAAPQGWKELPKGGPMRVAAFEATSGDQRAETTVIPLGGGAGGVLQNVNRWRDQIGLGPIDDATLESELRHINVAGRAAPYVVLVGPESAGEKRQSILAVMLERDDRTWFFKMTGSAPLVADQRPAFEEFVRSVKFE